MFFQLLVLILYLNVGFLTFFFFRTGWRGLRTGKVEKLFSKKNPYLIVANSTSSHYLSSKFVTGSAARNISLAYLFVAFLYAGFLALLTTIVLHR